MIYNAKEHELEIKDIHMNYITFGNGEKPLVMISGLSTRSIKGAAVSLAYMYRIFAGDYKVYLFDRRENIGEIKISPGTLYGSLSKMEKDGLIKFIREEQKRKIYCITELGEKVLNLEMKRIERLYKSMKEAK